MRELGLIEGGYTNDYGLERKATKWSLENKLNKVLRMAHERNSRVPLRKVEIPLEVTGEDMVRFAAEGLTGEKLSFSQSLALLKDKGILTREIESRVTDWKEVPDFAQMLSLLANLYEYLLKL
jgi:hypothetical protein